MKGEFETSPRLLDGSRPFPGFPACGTLAPRTTRKRGLAGDLPRVSRFRYETGLAGHGPHGRWIPGLGGGVTSVLRAGSGAGW